LPATTAAIAHVRPLFAKFMIQYEYEWYSNSNAKNNYFGEDNNYGMTNEFIIH
jgi:hypothetical protein